MTVRKEDIVFHSVSAQISAQFLSKDVHANQVNVFLLVHATNRDELAFHSYAQIVSKMNGKFSRIIVAKTIN